LRFGASTVVLSPSGWERRLGVLADAGVEVVELCAEFGPSPAGSDLAAAIATFDYTAPYAIERAGAGLRETGLALHSIHGPIFFGRERGDVGLDGLIESLCACIDACAAMGGRFVVTQDMAELLPPEEPHLASREALARLGDYAAGHGCVFAVENGAENEDAFHRMVETVGRTASALGHSGLGICLDLGHAQVWNLRDVPAAVREAGPWLRTCHFHDNLAMSDAHMPPGDGVVPWPAVLAEFERAAYRGPVLLELHSGGEPRDVTEAIGRSMEFLAATAGSYWEPAAAAGGIDVFTATEGDRARARRALGEAVRETGDAPAAVAADRFGDVVGWCERTPEGKRVLALAGNVDRSAVERALEETLARPCAPAEDVR
jgi:sugar phosphate isomerase/epimerase